MSKTIRSILSILLALIIIFPILYCFSASLFARTDFSTSPARFLPTTVTFSNYARAFKASNLARFLVNSLICATVGTFLRMSISLFSAYSLTMFHYKGRYALFIIIIATMLLPGDALLIQNYVTIQRLGLTDTYLGLISTSLLAPTSIFILRQFFLTVSKEYREAAYLEGCSDTRFMVTLLIPMSQSLIVALTVQSFIQIFNDYLWPLLVTNSEMMRTVQVGITMLGFSESFDYGPQFAAMATLMCPMLILFIVFRKKIYEGVSTRFSGR